MLSLAALEAEALGVPVRLADVPRVNIGGTVGTDVLLANMTASAVIRKLEERGLIDRREKQAEASGPKRPSYVLGLAKAASRAKQLLRESGAALRGIRYGQARVRWEDRDYADRVVRTVLEGLGRGHLADRVAVVPVRPLGAGEEGTLFVSPEPILGGVREEGGLVEVYVHRDVYADPRRLVRVVTHELGHVLGLGEDGAARLEKTVFGR